MHKQLEKLWKECVRAFIREASLRIAIDTGMSAASMLPLAAKVRLASFLRAQISGASRGTRRGYTDMDFTYNKSQMKSMAHGQRLGQKAYKLSFGSPLNPKLTFDFDIVVLQHWLHDSSSNYQRSSNWKSLEIAKAEFLSTWKRLLPTYINPIEINRWLITGVFRSAK